MMPLYIGVKCPRPNIFLFSTPSGQLLGPTTRHVNELLRALFSGTQRLYMKVTGHMHLVLSSDIHLCLIQEREFRILLQF
jgi:hypothetical protein